MKKIICIVLAVCLLFSALPLAFAQEGITVDGTWTILIPASPTSYESFAADKLKTVLTEVFGTEIAVVASAAEHYIAVGAASAADVSGVAVNGYRIKAIDGNIHINGTGVRGLQAGAYRFLEEFCGRKVYTSKITVLPTAESIAVPADTDIVYEPFFEYTDTDWRSPRDWEYSMANGLNGGPYRALPAEMGGSVNYLGGFCHTMCGLCETESFKDSHPEYLALHDGERTTDQPCLTNPDVLEIAKRNVLAIAAAHHDPNASVQIISVTQNDNYNYCECERCKAFEEAHGGVQSATMIHFVNQIADAVKEAGYDNIAIDTFAYQYTRKAPTGIAPRDNVIVRLCTIECCFAHALDDPFCAQNADLMKDLSDWSKICGRIYVWDYTTNYAHTCTVFPDFGVIRRNIQVFYENNVRGVYEEGNYYIDSCDTEFGELRAYMIAKCLQDPYCDIDSEIDGFLEAYYGPGWKNIRAALDMYTEYAGNKDGHLQIYFGSKDSMQLTDRQVAQIDRYWKNAKAAAETEEQLANIKRSEISWRFWKANLRKGEYSLANPKRYDEKQKLFNDIVASGASTISEGGYNDYQDCICVKYAPPDEWNDYEADEQGARTRLFFGKLLERFMPLLTALGFYYMIAKAVNNSDC
ncbi:MAG: DUF4838 domain-containing protein [Clostridia bacterium]|nr:DUF4838 domain-containing protein [Clostridia bacterium]